MTSCPASTIIAASGVSDVTFTVVTADGIKEECSAEVSGASGSVDLIVDGVSSEMKLTLHGGDGPTATGDRVFVLPTGKSKCITVSTGEAVHADGTIRFTLEAEGGFNTLKPRIAILKHLNVVTH